MKKIILAIIAAAISCTLCGAAEPTLKPSGTYRFAQRDTCDLFLDIYEPAEGSATTIGGKEKPTVIYVFGGGFISGRRDGKGQIPFYRELTRNGYRVAAIDYRLGLKGVKNPGVNVEFVKRMFATVSMATEDLLSATAFLLEKGGSIGIDPYNLVVCGSSAGAITALQAEWEICNGTDLAKILPKGFNYKGVISFSGAILNKKGGAVYDIEPCPTLLMHGTADKIVTYKKIQFFNICFAGSNEIAKAFIKKGYNYNFLRFTGRGHEIAGSMCLELPEVFRFLETNVMCGERRIVDSEVSDPTIPTPDWARKDYSVLYKN